MAFHRFPFLGSSDPSHHGTTDRGVLRPLESVANEGTERKPGRSREHNDGDQKYGLHAHSVLTSSELLEVRIGGCS